MKTKKSQSSLKKPAAKKRSKSHVNGSERNSFLAQKKQTPKPLKSGATSEFSSSSPMLWPKSSSTYVLVMTLKGKEPLSASWTLTAEAAAMLRRLADKQSSSTCKADCLGQPRRK